MRPNGEVEGKLAEIEGFTQRAGGQTACTIFAVFEVKKEISD